MILCLTESFLNFLFLFVLMLSLKFLKRVTFSFVGFQSRDRQSEQQTDFKTPSELRNYLCSHLWQSNWNGPIDFVPEGQIYNLLTETTIRRLLRLSRRRIDDALVDYIVTRAKRLFTLTILINQEDYKLVDYMTFFRDNGYRDSKLMAGTNFESVDVQTNELSHFQQEIMEDLQNERLFQSFPSREITEKQWQVLTPVFSTEVDSYYFHGRVVLPFRKVKTDTNRPMRGAFSEVFKIEIHPDHFIDPLNKVSLSTQTLSAPRTHHEQTNREQPKFFAVKRLIPPPEEAVKIEESWKREIQALKLMNRMPDTGKHIIRCIAGFMQLDQYHLILEWADGGTLEDLYSDHKTPKLDGKLMQQVVSQLSGLAAALKATHGVQLSTADHTPGDNIRHGDLKPGNVLRFVPSDKNIIGNLKIGDWGLAKLHNMATSERVVNNIYTDNRYGTSRYEPPETTGTKIILSRRFDTWSMGVVILEMLIWLLHGYDALGSFRQGIRIAKPIRETCWHTVSEGNKNVIRLETSVIKWLEFLKRDPICKDRDRHTSALAAVLDVVETRLLVVDIGNEGEPTQQRLFHLPEKGQQGLVGPEFIVTRPTALEPSPINVSRATAEEFSQILENILVSAEDEDYWYRESIRPPLPDELKGTVAGLQPGGDFVVTPSASSSRSTELQALRVGNLSVQDQQFVSRTAWQSA